MDCICFILSHILIKELGAIRKDRPPLSIFGGKRKMNKPFPTWTLQNENAILSVISKQGFASVQAEVARHIEENAMGSATQGFWIDVNRYLRLLKNPFEFERNK